MTDPGRDAGPALAVVSRSDFILALSGAVTPAVLQAAQGRVRLVQLLSAGYDEVDVGPARQLGIPMAADGGAKPRRWPSTSSCWSSPRTGT